MQEASISPNVRKTSPMGFSLIKKVNKTPLLNSRKKMGKYLFLIHKSIHSSAVRKSEK